MTTRDNDEITTKILNNEDSKQFWVKINMQLCIQTMQHNKQEQKDKMQGT